MSFFMLASFGCLPKSLTGRERPRKLETSAVCGQQVRELRTGADAELAIDTRQRCLD
jgi:hypothetical protein